MGEVDGYKFLVAPACALSTGIHAYMIHVLTQIAAPEINKQNGVIIFIKYLILLIL